MPGLPGTLHGQEYLSEMAENDVRQQYDLSDQRQLQQPVQCGLGEQAADLHRRSTVQQGRADRTHQVPEHDQFQQARGQGKGQKGSGVLRQVHPVQQQRGQFHQDRPQRDPFLGIEGAYPARGGNRVPGASGSRDTRLPPSSGAAGNGHREQDPNVVHPRTD